MESSNNIFLITIDKCGKYTIMQKGGYYDKYTTPRPRQNKKGGHHGKDN